MENETIDFLDNSNPSEASIFSFYGRCNRKAYWSRYLLLLFMSIGLGLLVGIISLIPVVGMVVTLIFTCFIGYAAFCVQVRRFHDMGWSALVPTVLLCSSLTLNILAIVGLPVLDASMLLALINFVTLIIIGCIPGQPGLNKYGSNPLYDFDYQVEEYRKQHRA